MKISTQIALSYFLILGMASYFFLAVFIHDIKPGVTQSVEETLVDTANVLAELAAPDLVSGHIGTGAFARAVTAYSQRTIDAPISGLHKTTADYRVRVTDSSGIVVYDSAARDLGLDYSQWNDVYRTLRGAYGARSTATDPTDRSTAVLHVAAPILDHGRIIGVLTVAKADATIAPFIRRAESTVRMQGIALILAAAATGIFFTWRLTRSIERLRRYAKAVSDGLRVPLPTTMNREIAELGVALEGMRDELDGKVYVEQYVHALTHELKSPVAAIQGAAELLDEDLAPGDRARFVGNIRDQATRIGLISDRLLELARIEQLHALEIRTPIVVQDTIMALLAKLEPRLRERSLRCEVSGTALPINGDPFLVEQALRNLLENAIDFAPPASLILISLTDASAGCDIAVADSGPGVPAYAQSRVFERFYSLARPDSGKKSTGLGLPLVIEVAKLHGGYASVGNRSDGAGAVAHLYLART